jgi:L-ribulose-5-phosphate 4-epimerase
MGAIKRGAMGAKANSRLRALRAEVARYAQKMSASGLARATQGNLSARDAESGLVCVTPSGADYDTLTAADIVVVTLDGEIVEGRWKPSVESPAHLEVYRRRADVGCVIHTHSIYASVFSALYRPIPLLLAESAYCLGGSVPIAPYQESGTLAFAVSVADILGDAQAVLWGNHGAMAVGSAIAQAYSVAHALEDSARVAWLAGQIGVPHELPDEAARRLHASWRASYGQRAVSDHTLEDA